MSFKDSLCVQFYFLCTFSSVLWTHGLLSHLHKVSGVACIPFLASSLHDEATRYSRSTETVKTWVLFLFFKIYVFT